MKFVAHIMRNFLQSTTMIDSERLLKKIFCSWTQYSTLIGGQELFSANKHRPWIDLQNGGKGKGMILLFEKLL